MQFLPGTLCNPFYVLGEKPNKSKHNHLLLRALNDIINITLQSFFGGESDIIIHTERSVLEK